MRVSSRTRRLFAGLLLALVLALVAGAPGSSAATTGPRAPAGPHGAADAALVPAGEAVALPQPRTVRFGAVLAASEAGVFLAEERGYFAEQGMAIEYERIDAGSFSPPPLSIGELDAALGVGGAALYNSVLRGLDIRIVAPMTRTEPGYSQLILSVRKDLIDSGDIRDYGDLRGRTLAIIGVGGISELTAERALQRAGLSLSDVNYQNMNPSDQLAALGNRAIDVGLNTEPQATIAADRGIAVKWREAAEWTPGLEMTHILYGPNFLTRDQDAGRRWMVAYLKGVRDYYNAIVAGRGGREAVIDSLVRNTTLKDRALYDRMLWTYLDPNLALNEDDVRNTMQWFLGRGLIDRPVDLNQLIDGRFAQHALSALGPYQ